VQSQGPPPNQQGQYNNQQGQYNNQQGQYNNQQGQYNNQQGQYNNQQGQYQQGGQMGGQQGQNPAMGGGQQGGQQGGVQQPPIVTQPQTTTIKVTPMDPGGVPVTQTRPEEVTTTTTIFSDERPALAVTGSPNTERDECVNFRVSSLPTDCCELPRLYVPENVTEKCHKECKESTNGTHCCFSQCKYRELNIYKGNIFNSTSIEMYLEQSIKNRSDAVIFPWRKAIAGSMRYCLWDQMSKETTRPPFVSTTDRTKYLMNNAIQNGQGHYVNTDNQQRPQQPVYTTPPGTTEPLYIRQNKNRYCGIPVYVFRVVACMRVVNFVNCPFFNRNSTECMTKREDIMKCGRKLNYTV
jgi:hypothetical protein